MNKYLLNTIGAALLAVLGIAGWALYQFGVASQQTSSVLVQVGRTLTESNKAIDLLTSGLSTTFDALNRGCEQGKPCGTLADINKTLGTVRGTFGQIESAANHEDKQLRTLDSQESSLFSDTHIFLTNLIALEVKINDTVGGIEPLESKLGLEIDELHKTTADADALLTDPEVIDLIKHTDSTMSNVDSLSGDIQKKTHELIYPAKCEGKLCWAKRTYSIVRGAVELGEPAYYWGALSTQILK